MTEHLHLCPTCTRKHACEYGTCTPPRDGTTTSPDQVACDRCLPGAKRQMHRQALMRRLKKSVPPELSDAEWFKPAKEAPLHMLSAGYAPAYGQFYTVNDSVAGRSSAVRDAVSTQRNRIAVHQKRRQLRRARPNRPPTPRRR